MHIHVSNLHSNLIEADLMRLFSKFGEVASVELMRDKLNNRSLCHGFIDMPVKKEAEQAVASLDKSDVNGRKVSVDEVVYDPVPHASWSHSPKG
ncbi:MAG: RNA-binding protein [Chitinophagaceae bacterium]|nr:MAG: RNA-binding protein [Chitinophagaceae bacterium]